jgi:hypothetical protein
MKKILILALLSLLFACDDETSNPNNSIDNLSESYFYGNWDTDWHTNNRNTDTINETAYSITGVTYDSGFQLNDDKIIGRIWDGKLLDTHNNYKWNYFNYEIVFAHSDDTAKNISYKIEVVNDSSMILTSGWGIYKLNKIQLP